MRRQFDFTVEGIVGTVYLPDGAEESLPVICCCHGWGGSRKLWRLTEKLKNKCASRGCVLVTFDFFGCGDTGGDPSEITYDKWRDNLATVMRYIASQPFADVRRIGCFGFSSGSTAVFRYALQKDSLCTFIISVATCASSNIGMASGGPAAMLARDERITRFMDVDLERGFFEDCINNAPLSRLCEIAVPMLILQGMEDNIYRIADSKDAAERLPNCERFEFPGAGHSLEPATTSAANLILDWMRRIGVVSFT